MQTPFPKISIITPSFSQGDFIEKTILSVLGQGYPNFEYIIMDGVSTDNIINIIKKYSDYVTYWISEKDDAQSHATNKGFKRATGDILCWLNSDDIYMPGILTYVSQKIDVSKRLIYFGNCLHFKENNNGLISWGSDVVSSSKNTLLVNVDYIIQPFSFWTRRAWELAGSLFKRGFAFCL